jgi:hypothetical protein
MTNQTPSVVQPDVLTENMQSIHSFLRESYSQAKAHFQHGITVFKDEFMEIYHHAETYLTMIASPINNFLKDHTEIENELQKEALSEPAAPAHNQNIVPIEIAMMSPMEENY